jgi:hypothetical protein
MSDKDTYKEKMQAQLDEWKEEIGKLKEKATTISAEAKAEINIKIQGLEDKVKEGKIKLEELAEATEDAWENVKDGLETFWNSVKKNIQETVDKIKEG